MKAKKQSKPPADWKHQARFHIEEATVHLHALMRILDDQGKDQSAAFVSKTKKKLKKMYLHYGGVDPDAQND